MKLIRFGPPEQEKPGLQLPDGRRIDASAFGGDYDESFFGGVGMKELGNWADAHAAGAPEVPPDTRLGPPIARPSKIICIGLNFSDHAAESGMQIPEEPIIFFKSSSALCGPNDDLILPCNSSKVDWEVELTFVIGRRASYVSEEQASDHIAGYALMNDYSERVFQLERGGQWVKGKSCDRFAPLGPYLATSDELNEVNDLAMWLKVNGETLQNSNTSNLIFRIPTLLSYVSQFMTLLPGDLISTGTPAGVGLGLKPPHYLKEGDEVELGIEGLGSSKQRVIAAV